MGAGLAAVGEAIGMARWSTVVRLLLLAALAAVGFVLDTGRARVPLPTIHRQVNEQWLYQYRGWYYGLGFGFQLGLGVVTIVTTSVIYLCLAVSALTGSPVAGALIGAAFGLARAASLLVVARVDSPARLAGVGIALERWSRAARVATQAGLAVVAAAAAGLAVS
jgi:hypothetical protein